MATVSSLNILSGGTSDVHTYNDDQYTQLVQFDATQYDMLLMNAQVCHGSGLKDTETNRYVLCMSFITEAMADSGIHWPMQSVETAYLPHGYENTTGLWKCYTVSYLLT